MPERPDSLALVSRVSKIEGQVSALTETVNNFVSASEVWRRDFATEMRSLATHFTDRTQPNTTMMFAVIIGICAFFFSREMSRSHEDNVALDTKLQREFTLMNTNTEQKYHEVDGKSLERHESVTKVLDGISQWQRDRDREDRQELIMYRTQKLGNLIKPTNPIALP